MAEHPASCRAPSHTPQAALERVFEAAACRTQVELAAFLGIRQSSISDAKRRHAIPTDWLMTLLQKKGINPQWIETGEGPQYMQPCAARTALHEYSMEELLREIMRRAAG